MESLTKKVRNSILALSLIGIFCGFGISKYYSNKKQAFINELYGDLEFQKYECEKTVRKLRNDINPYIIISDKLEKKFKTLSNYEFYQDCGSDLSYLSVLGLLFGLAKKKKIIWPIWLK